MKAALAVFQTQPQIAQNVAVMCDLIAEAAAQGANLVVFAETALTGFVLSGRDAQADYGYAVAVDGSEINQLQTAAREHDIWVAFGFLERNGNNLHDSALLLDAQGQTQLHYRRMSQGWRWPDAPAEFVDGTTMPTAETPFGRVAFLLCGDAFDSAIVQQAKATGPNVLLYPFARSFENEVPADWQAEYVEVLRDIAPTVLAVNGLDTDRIGGAFAMQHGEVMATLPLDTPGLLLIDLPEVNP